LELRGEGRDVLVLTATSGDTGKAALEGFRDVPRTAIEVFYPAEGVSALQKLQMVTQDGGNTDVCAVRGNFDDAQTGVKRLFMDADFRRRVGDAGYMLSSANSINIGRLAPQVAYYVWAYVRLAASGRIGRGEQINFCVPTGNFGNILAAYYARRCGLPVGRLICASNKNNILTDFFHRGGYDTRRTFYKTMSPSMDILVSSNLERLLFEISERDEQAVAGWMRSLASDGRYEIPPHARNALSALFYADFCSEEETAATIKKTFDDFGYLIDTHTAVAQCVYNKYAGGTADTGVTVVVATANPYKFTQDVLKAVGGEDVDDAFEAAEKLERMTGVPVPGRISELKTRPVLHDREADISGQADAVYGFVKRIGERGDA
jgi:threonine synthase